MNSTRLMILGITPARGGSKGVPRKNIRTLCGKPLLVWTIEAAVEVAGQSGAEVLERLERSASNEAPTLSVLQRVLALVLAEVLRKYQRCGVEMGFQAVEAFVVLREQWI